MKPETNIEISAEIGSICNAQPPPVLLLADFSATKQAF